MATALHRSKGKRSTHEKLSLHVQQEFPPSPPRSVYSTVVRVANPRPLYPEQLVPVVFPEEHQVYSWEPKHLFHQRNEEDLESVVAHQLDGQPFAPFASPGPSFAGFRHSNVSMSFNATSPVAPRPVMHHRPSFMDHSLLDAASPMLSSAPRLALSFIPKMAPRYPDPRSEFEIVTPEGSPSSIPVQFAIQGHIPVTPQRPPFGVVSTNHVFLVAP